MSVEMVLANEATRIFILPLCLHPFRFSLVFSPDFLESKQGIKPKDKIQVYTFQGFDESMKKALLHQIMKIFTTKHQQFEQKRMTRILGGGALVLLGIIDFFIFDPIPLFIDEILIIAGGFISLKSGLIKGKLPAIPESQKLEQNISFQEHPLLTKLKEMLEQLSPQSEIDEEDVLGELEYFLKTLIQENQHYTLDLAYLCDGYKSQNLLNQLFQLESQLNYKKMRKGKRLKLLEEKMKLLDLIKTRLQIPQAAITLYTSLLLIREKMDD